MAFLDEYKITTAPKAVKATAPQLSPIERARMQMTGAVEEQKKYLEAIKEGKSVSFERNGKAVKPRLFWEQVPTGFLFTPRVGIKFLFPKGTGIAVSSLEELGVVLDKFSVAAAAGEFDKQLLEILEQRKSGAPRGRKAKVV